MDDAFTVDIGPQAWPIGRFSPGSQPLSFFHHFCSFHSSSFPVHPGIPPVDKWDDSDQDGDIEYFLLGLGGLSPHSASEFIQADNPGIIRTVCISLLKENHKNRKPSFLCEEWLRDLGLLNLGRQCLSGAYHLTLTI